MHGAPATHVLVICFIVPEFVVKVWYGILEFNVPLDTV